MINMTENTTPKYYFSRGRRKTAHARVKLYPGTGVLKINNKICELDKKLLEPLQILGMEKKWDIEAYVNGGGKISQIESIRLAIARAIIVSDLSLKTTLKKSNLLTRDSREKERKKPGLKRARRAPQWSKR